MKKIRTCFLLLGLLTFVSIVAVPPAQSGPLHEAAKKGDSDKVKSLLSALNNRSKKINEKDNMSNTALHWAANEGKKEVADLLIDYGADINAKDNYGRTPLHRAAYNGHRDLAQLLITHGANINENSNEGNTPLHEAAQNDRKDVADLLIGKGGDINAKNKHGNTPLHQTIEWSHRPPHLTFWDSSLEVGVNKAVAELLITRGANVNSRNANGITPLHEAALRGNTYVATLLIKRGADVHSTDEKGKSALHYAVYSGYKEAYKDIIHLLTAKGAQFYTKDKSGVTHIHAAPIRKYDSVSRDWRETFIETDAEIVFKPFPSSIGVSRSERIVTRLAGGKTYTRLTSVQQRKLIEKLHSWMKGDVSHILWIDNGMSDWIVFSKDDKTFSEVKVPERSILPIKVSPGILKATIFLKDGRVFKNLTLNVNGMEEKNVFVYNIADNIYHLESKRYK